MWAKDNPPTSCACCYRVEKANRGKKADFWLKKGDSDQEEEEGEKKTRVDASSPKTDGGRINHGARRKSVKYGY